MYEYSLKPEFYRYFEYGPHKNVNETKQYLDNLIDLSNTQNGFYWFIKLKEKKKIIGTFGVLNIDEKRFSAEIGYGLSPDYWGRGFFKEALILVLKHLFFNLNFIRISSKTRFDNLPSIKGLEKVGFKKEGIMRDFYNSSNGKRFDAILYSILRGEFQEKYKEN